MKTTKFFKRSRMGKVSVDQITSPCSIHIASDSESCQIFLMKHDDNTRVIILASPNELIELQRQIEQCTKKFLTT